jgi:glycosyltransferase involved in cell wall biosynthesis
MRIVIVAAVFPPEPVVSARILYELACRLSVSHEVIVLKPRPSRPHGFLFENFEPNNKIRVIELVSFVYSRSNFIGRFIESISFGMSSSFFLFYNYKRYDIVYNGAWPLFGQLFVSLTCAIFQKKYLLPIQDIYPEAVSHRIPYSFRWLLNILRMIDKINLRLASKIYTISDNLRQYISLTRGVKLEKIDLLYNWQNTSDFSFSPMAKRSERFSFMYLGNIGKASGIIYLIDFFNRAGLDKCDLYIAGSGSVRREAEEFTHLNQIDNVHFLDVPFGNVDAVQQMADVLILFTLGNTSIYSVPSKLPAYMMSSKPVLAFVHPESETSRIINSSGCGWAVDSNNNTAFIKLLQQIPGLETSRLDHFGKNGSAFAREYMSEKNLNLLVLMIENLV